MRARARRITQKQRRAEVRGQVSSSTSCVRACGPSGFHARPELSRSTRGRPKERTAHSLVRRIFMAPFLLLPLGFDILIAHLTLRTAHRRRNWRVKRGAALPPKRTRDGDGVRCSTAPRTGTCTHTRATQCAYERACERSLVENAHIDSIVSFSKPLVDPRSGSRESPCDYIDAI